MTFKVSGSAKTARTMRTFEKVGIFLGACFFHVATPVFLIRQRVRECYKRFEKKDVTIASQKEGLSTKKRIDRLVMLTLKEVKRKPHMKGTASTDKNFEHSQMTKPKLAVKGIMLDLDGTILDTKPAYLETGRIAFEKLGQQSPEAVQLLEIPKRIEQKQPFTDITKTVDYHKFLTVYLETFYSISAAKTKPMPQVEKTLEVLSKNAPLAVITMRFMSKENIFAELKQYNLDGYFSHVVTALDTAKPKPSPEALIKAAGAMGVQMCDCVIVGDSIVDVLAGKAAGSKTVAVLSGLYSHVELSKTEPNFIINDISELPTLLE